MFVISFIMGFLFLIISSAIGLIYFNTVWGMTLGFCLFCIISIIGLIKQTDKVYETKDWRKDWRKDWGIFWRKRTHECGDILNLPQIVLLLVCFISMFFCLSIYHFSEIAERLNQLEVMEKIENGRTESIIR